MSIWCSPTILSILKKKNTILIKFYEIFVNTIWKKEKAEDEHTHTHVISYCCVVEKWKQAILTRFLLCIFLFQGNSQPANNSSCLTWDKTETGRYSAAMLVRYLIEKKISPALLCFCSTLVCHKSHKHNPHTSLHSLYRTSDVNSGHDPRDKWLLLEKQRSNESVRKGKLPAILFE